MNPATDISTTVTSGSGHRDTTEADVLVRAQGLFKIYKEGAAETVALQGAAIDLRAGESVSLVGPSGSGKTTLLWILAGLGLPSAGQVFVDGVDITRLDETSRAAIRAQRVGLVFQRGNLIPFLTAEENVVLALEMGGHRHGAKAQARDLLGELALANRGRHYPRQLSGGESQRVGIAVAIANEPALLFGDEVTGELDTATSEFVMALLARLQRERGLTMMLVTHNPGQADQADRQLAIVDGMVAEL